ncbi:MAG TPA: TIGR04222 domain-containing membrane protein [Isosphaeraceae bacterium]|nr:TIGR04222 domain-containing membrane protein [Isosphaeraceae bacterium]
MSWLLHNFIADMPGPVFLLLYLLVIAAVVAASSISIRTADQTRGMETPQIPPKLDPYELAYLRGGENEVTRAAIASLIEREFLQIAEQKSGRTKSKRIGRTSTSMAGQIDPVESRVLDWAGFPALPSEIFRPNGLSSRVAAVCAGYHVAKCGTGPAHDLDPVDSREHHDDRGRSRV